jgi:WD40 repeat protein
LSGDYGARGDYDGDGKADLAVARPGNGITYIFFIQRSADGNWMTGSLGNPNGDVLAPGDYDGDGKTDIAVVGRRGDFQTHIWRWIRSSDGVFRSLRWGTSNDQAVAGDYDGDGTTDIATYRQTLNCMGQSQFFINGSRTGFMVVPFGTCGYSAIEFYR